MEDAERPSKTRRKKDMHELQALGERLVELSSAQLAQVDMPDDLRDAVLEARRITGREGRRRQLQYIGRLMRDIDPAPIRAKLDEWHGQSREATAQMHAIERWRERLHRRRRGAHRVRRASIPASTCRRCARPSARRAASVPPSVRRSISATSSASFARRCRRGRRHDSGMSSAPPDRPLRVGLVSISDRASAGVYRDEGLPALQGMAHARCRRRRSSSPNA